MVPYIVAEMIHVLLFLLDVCMLRECKDASVTAILVWGGVVGMSAGNEYVVGTRGSGIVSVAADADTCHLICTQCSILLHLIDICFLTCIC